MIPQLIAGGLLSGAIYALAAMGFVLLWQASRTINFAQGEFIMLPAFGVVLFQEVLKLPFPIAVMFTLVGSMAMGLIVTAMHEKKAFDVRAIRGSMPKIPRYGSSVEYARAARWSCPSGAKSDANAGCSGCRLQMFSSFLPRDVK